MARCIDFQELKPAMGMVLVQTVFSIVNICYKLAANDGMNLSILIGYRFMFGAAFIAPIAFFAERNKRPKLTKKIVFYCCLCGLFGGSLGQNLYIKGLVLTSATFASAMTNLIPAITFVVALSLRLERLGWKTAAGKAKALGTMIGIGGAMVITFYKGRELDLWDTHINLLHTTATHHHPTGLLPQSKHGGHRYILGAVLSLLSCVCYSLWLITQAKTTELFPCPYSITAIMALAASLQGIAFALTVDSNWNQWKLGWNIRLFTVAFSGFGATGLMFSVVAWCVRARGPLFVSVFQPLMLVMVGLMGSLFLEEKLHLGMVIGAIFIVAGLYIVLWGKRKEVPPPPPPPLNNGESRAEEEPQNASTLNNNESRAEEEVEAEVEEETHINIPPLPPPPPPNSNRRHSNKGRRTDTEAEAEAEAEEEEMHIDIPAPPPPPQIYGSSHSSKGTSVDEEGESHEDTPPPKNSISGGRVEAEVDSRIEPPLSLPLPPPPSQLKNSTSSSSGSGVEEQTGNGSDNSCSDSRVESRRRIDELPLPLQKQSSSNRGNEVEVEAHIELPPSLQSGSAGNIKEVEVEVGKRGKEKSD